MQFIAVLPIDPPQKLLPLRGSSIVRGGRDIV